MPIATMPAMVSRNPVPVVGGGTSPKIMMRTLPGSLQLRRYFTSAAAPSISTTTTKSHTKPMPHIVPLIGCIMSIAPLPVFVIAAVPTMHEDVHQGAGEQQQVR